MNRLSQLLLGFALIGCVDVVEYPTEKNGRTEPSVFLLGIKSGNWVIEDNLIACIVNDSIPVQISNVVHGYYSLDFHIDKTGTYVTGSRFWGESKLWKNEVLLNNWSNRAHFEAMEIVGGHSYLAGYEWLDNWAEQATIWKDAVASHLLFTDPAFDYNRAFDVAASGSDVYAVGWEFDTDGVTAHNGIIWKNGVPQVLSPPSGFESARPMAIAVSGEDTYVTGYVHKQNGSLTPTAVTWKNGEPTILEYPLEREHLTWAIDIAVYGDDVHIAGRDQDHAIYWKNGKAFVLPGSVAASRISSVTSLFVFEGNVFISGTEHTDNSHGIYWKNGIPKAIPSLLEASCVFVTRLQLSEIP